MSIAQMRLMEIELQSDRKKSRARLFVPSGNLPLIDELSCLYTS